VPLDIAVFCRNVEAVVGCCLLNLKEQSQALDKDLRPLRVVVMESGSQDQSAKVARQWAHALSQPGTFEICVLSLPRPGKTVAWNTFLSLATSPLVGFLDGDSVLSPHALARLTAVIQNHPELDIVGAIPALPPGFSPQSFWQSLFAVPYRDLTPWPSLSGNAYLARRDRLKPMPDDVVNEDLYLAIRHAGAIRLCKGARVYVTPPTVLIDFIRQRARIRRGDAREWARQRVSLSQHRRSALRNLTAFQRAAGLRGLAAFLSASGLALLAARMPFLGRAIETGWTGGSAGAPPVLQGAGLRVVNAANSNWVN
jgi:cellulose synthase/poly-beta-1,6-N-acetylglucosamine synthase-like glycosyltransferase